MRLKLHNILKVEEADIELGGLTVITGENDSGKSSIGKILFSLLKAVNNVRRADQFKAIDDIFREIVSIQLFFANKGVSLYSLPNARTTSYDLIDHNISTKEYYDLIMITADKNKFDARRTAILRKKLEHINQIIFKLDNPEKALVNEFDAISKSEFIEPLNSHYTTDSEIYFHDDTTNADGSNINITFKDGKITDLKVSGKSSLEDITYIESPVYLHILDSLRMSNSPSGNYGKIPYHLSDMADKLLSPSIETLYSIVYDYTSQLNEISSIIKGSFEVDNETKQLYFNKDGMSIPTVSVASGIKSFGMLMQLIKTGSLSTSKMLILDEPEIHLHPEWQINFCRLIVELVAQGVPIVVSSHSPYFIQGLRYYSAAKGIEKDVKYYMSETNANNSLSTFNNVTDDLNKVFTLLAAPWQEIMNVDAVRNSMK